jgi:hypothetical protein
MSRIYVNAIKKNAVIQVPFNTDDISKLHCILLKHLDNKVSLDDDSWQTIELLCSKIDEYARLQNQTESKEVNF